MMVGLFLPQAHNWIKPRFRVSTFSVEDDQVLGARNFELESPFPNKYWKVTLTKKQSHNYLQQHCLFLQIHESTQ